MVPNVTFLNTQIIDHIHPKVFSVYLIPDIATYRQEKYQ